MRIIKLTAAVEEKLLRSREGEDREAMKAAARIVNDVRRGGDAALEQWARKLDGVELKRDGLWVSRAEFAAAKRRVSKEFLRAVEHAAKNVRRVAEAQLPGEWTMEVERGVRIGQVVRPVESIGCYIPGGRFALFSTLVMTVVPAQVAGVRRIVAVSPKANDELLAAAAVLGVRELGRVGGEQAIAALAYGTKRMARVEKIFGPGNRFVTAAKKIVSTDCAIDLPAGPTEAVVLAEQGNARWMAADLLAQAEHAPDAGSYLVTTSMKLAEAVREEIAEQLKKLPKNNPAQVSIRKNGAILLTGSKRAAVNFVNRFAPEHLSLPGAEKELLKEIRSAGTVFMGPLSAQAFGDYASGSNHVLPTAGWARRRGGLSAADFVKCISVQKIDRAGFSGLQADVQTLARAEGLLAHASAVEVRK